MAKANDAHLRHPPSDRTEDTSGDGCGSTVNVVYLPQDFIGNLLETLTSVQCLKTRSAHITGKVF